MGTGDWNDGMNRVGHEGRGESVWLALVPVRRRRALRADRRSARRARARASAGARRARGWRARSRRAAGTAQWYRRAFFDDGSPLGSAANAECRIDLIAQAWAVLSGAAPEPRARAGDGQRVERELRRPATPALVRLLDPPLQHAEPSAGYIQAYPPGVRENGGQYTHAGGVGADGAGRSSATPTRPGATSPA